MAIAVQRSSGGWISGLIGILIFSGSLPATRIAVMDFDPLFLTVARATIAGVLAATLLLISRPNRPQKSDWMSLLVVAGGVVVGFPLLTALALEHITSARSIVFIGLLPLATAILASCAVVKGHNPYSGCFRLSVAAWSPDLPPREAVPGRYAVIFYAWRGYRLRAWLCRGCKTVAPSWWMAGDLLGVGDIAFADGGILRCDLAR